MQILQLLRDNAGREKRALNLAKNATEATLYMYGMIFEEEAVNALAVVDALSQLDGVETLNIRINSPGGDVFEGRAIMAAIRDFKGKTVAHVDSLCASAATSIALACDEIVMTDGAFFMIHNVHGLAYGDKSKLRTRADNMEKIEGAIVQDYANKTGKQAEQITAWMDAETWFTAAEALENGFVDNVVAAPTSKTKNAWNLAAYKQPPKALTDPPADDPPPENKTEEPAPEAGFFMSAANANRLRLLQIA